MRHWKKLAVSALAVALTTATTLSGCQFDIRTESSTPQTTEAASTEAAAEPPSTEVPSTTKPDDVSSAVSPMMWQVTGEQGNTLYLFGTIHMGDSRNEEVMTLVSDKLESCDALAVEFDIDAFEKDEAASAALAVKLLYTDGTTAKDHLRSDLYEKSVAYLTACDAYNEMYDYFVVNYWTTLLQQAAIEKTAYSPENAMDTKLLTYAKQHGKEILEVESAEFQFDMEADMPDELAEMQIESFFEDTDSFEDDLTELYEAWLSGDEEALTEMEYGVDEEEYKQLTEEEKTLYADYQKVMLTDRNVGMADKAETYLKSGKSVFFAVGAGHMVSKEGVVQLLKDKGYTVSAVSVNTGTEQKRLPV